MTWSAVYPKQNEGRQPPSEGLRLSAETDRSQMLRPALSSDPAVENSHHTSLAYVPQPYTERRADVQTYLRACRGRGSQSVSARAGRISPPRTCLFWQEGSTRTLSASRTLVQVGSRPHHRLRAHRQHPSISRLSNWLRLKSARQMQCGGDLARPIPTRPIPCSPQSSHRVPACTSAICSNLLRPFYV